VPVGGAADRFSLAIGNALVGNSPDTPALEISLAGPMLVADAPLACVLYGAPFLIETDRRQLTAGTTFTLEPGEKLRIGGTAAGARACFCIQGGIDAPVILGSRSGLTPLRAGDTVRCRAGRIIGRRVSKRQGDKETRRQGDKELCEYGPEWILRILPGAQADWFPTEGIAGRFEVTAASNRMGVRLQGSALSVPAREIVSEPVCPGTVQVTRDGQCIVLGIDGQTIGGYPKIAQVIAADLDRIGQLRPGAKLAFQHVTLEEAEALLEERTRLLREWLTRLDLGTAVAATAAP
jgi:biotin-dependent carboxylase-like uncharacterized protein